MKIVKWILLGGLVLLVGVGGMTTCMLVATKNPAHAIGPLTGTVLDAETHKPIAGAKIWVGVKMIHATPLWMVGYNPPMKRALYFETDSNGNYKMDRYFVASRRILEWDMVIQKSGYMAYNNKRTFQGGFRNDFKSVENQVLLEKWNENNSSERNLRIQWVVLTNAYIGCERSENGSAFCKEAYTDMIKGCQLGPSSLSAETCMSAISALANDETPGPQGGR